jgi:hypothetical protein
LQRGDEMATRFGLCKTVSNTQTFRNRQSNAEAGQITDERSIY